MRIGIVAPSTPIEPALAEAVTAVAARERPEAELVFHPQCFLSDGHFAGPDAVRAAALIEVANDPAIDAIWFARGGYGACRVAEEVLDALAPAAGDKAWLGYSDAGFLLAGLFRRGIGRLAHGPMPADLKRDGGEAAVTRALGWLCAGDDAALEPSIAPGAAHAAFNMVVLSHLLGTELEPDLTGHVLMLEEVAEHTYRTDRALFHITSQPAIRRVAGVRLGRCTLVPENDRPFGGDELASARMWCDRAGIAFLGQADIGHDSANKVVPFGPWRS